MSWPAVATDQKPTAGLKQDVDEDAYYRALGRDGPETHCGIETWSRRGHASLTGRDGPETHCGIETPRLPAPVPRPPRRDGPETHCGIETAVDGQGNWANGNVATDQKPTAGLKHWSVWICTGRPACRRDGPETHCGIETSTTSQCSPAHPRRDGPETHCGIETRIPTVEPDRSRRGRDGPETHCGIETQPMLIDHSRRPSCRDGPETHCGIETRA